MFKLITNKQTNKQTLKLCLSFLALTLTCLDARADINDPPPCEKIQGLYLPDQFVKDIILGEDPDYTDFVNAFHTNYPEMNGYNDSAIMAKYPGLEQSLQAWRFRHHIYGDICQKQQNAEKLAP